MQKNGAKIEKDVVFYYSNPAGYIRDGKAVVDPLFQTDLAGRCGAASHELRPQVGELPVQPAGISEDGRL